MKACVLTGRERHRFVRGNIQRFRSAERPQLEWRATPVRARGPSPLFSLSNSPLLILLSFSFSPAGCGRASQPPSLPPSSPRPSPLLLSPPNPPIHPPTPGSRPVQPSHAWSSLGIHSGCFLFIASTLFSLSLSLFYICHSTQSTPTTVCASPPLLSDAKEQYLISCADIS